MGKISWRTTGRSQQVLIKKKYAQTPPLFSQAHQHAGKGGKELVEERKKSGSVGAKE